MAGYRPSMGPGGDLAVPDPRDYIREEPIKKPASRWRNHYMIKSIFFINKALYRAGDPYVSPRIWQSKEVAEAKAEKWLRKSTVGASGQKTGRVVSDFVDFMYALPEEDGHGDGSTGS